MPRLLFAFILAVAGLATAKELPQVLSVCGPSHPPSAGPCATPPKLIYSPDPTYSKEALKAKYEGTVVLWLIVGIYGHAHDVRVAKGIGMGLDASAVKTVKKWEFEPATFEGKPVPVQINVEVNFRMPHPAAGADHDSASASNPDGPLLVCSSAHRRDPGPCADTAPRPILTVYPDYPEDARRTGEQGIVGLRAVVGIDGRISNVRVVNSRGPKLDRAAVKAVSAWKFQPATYRGKAVAVDIDVQLSFRIP